ATNQDIAGRETAHAEATARAGRRRELIHRSDAVLAQLEGLNLVRYGAVKAWGRSRRLSPDQVVGEGGQRAPARGGNGGSATAHDHDALEGVFDAQSVIFGHPHDSEGTNEIRDRSGCRVADGRL